MMPPSEIDMKSASANGVVKKEANTLHEHGQFDDCNDDTSVEMASRLHGNGKPDECKRSSILTPASSPPTTPPLAESREEKDEAAGESQKISASGITKLDVLSGRGGGTNNHEGNRYFRRLCDQRRHDYVMSKKMRKKGIAKDIVEDIRSGGGRFLKRDDKTGDWEDIGEQKAISKTSQALREGLAQKMRQALVASGAAEQMRMDASAPPIDHSWQSPAGHYVGHEGPYAPGAHTTAPYWRSDQGYSPPSRKVSPDNIRKMPFSDHDTSKCRRMGF